MDKTRICLLPPKAKIEVSRAIRYALCAPRDWWPFERNQDERIEPGIALEIRPSDKGRYLTALLRMAGNIQQSKEIFLSTFWQTQFESLGATPKPTVGRVDRVTAVLRRRLRGGKIETDTEWEKVARVVLAQARAERFPSRFLRFDHLTENFEEFRTDYWRQHQAGAPDSEWVEFEKRSLADSITYLCRREILHQGHEWSCRECYNKNWLGIDDISRSMKCNICGNTQSPPVAGPWHFKLNEFVGEAIREQGLLPVIWCLSRLSRVARNSFFFLESQELFFSEESVDAKKNDAELDLLVVSDGRVYLCEAKASRSDIDVEKIANLAIRIRPDVVVLAVMESSGSALQTMLAQLQERLSGTGIAADLFTLANGDLEDSPLLPTGRTKRVRLF
jgi:hypothetical protein